MPHTAKTQDVVKTKSIKRNLINSLSAVFGLIVFGVFLSVDLSVDGWVDSQFDQAMLNKANSLKSHIRQVDSHIDVALNSDAAPEFKPGKDPQFYQVWQGEESLQRSASLEAYSNVDLLKTELPVGSSKIVPVELPNGLSGRASLSYFVPKVARGDGNPVPVYLTIYKSDQSTEHSLLIIDILLVSGFCLSLAIMRYLAVTIVDKGLKPLDSLNRELKSMLVEDNAGSKKVSSNTPRLLSTPARPVEEIEPIRQEINNYIQNNFKLLSNEKRITGDIAHELKTPISEIIALTEVYIRYPNDARIGETYKQDMLSIANRMRNIVEKLLLLQRTSSTSIELHIVPLELSDLLEQIVKELSFKQPDTAQRVTIESAYSKPLMADRFSLETILVNLLDNALFYGVRTQKVRVNSQVVNNALVLRIVNHVEQPLDDEQLEKLTDPLFQVDFARSDATRYGLGLSIVNNLCQLNGWKLSLSQAAGNTFIAALSLPLTDTRSAS